MKITKEQFEALTTEQKKLWKADGEEFVLIGDTEVAAESRRARDREKLRAEAAEAKVTELEARLSALEGDDAKKRGDIQSIEKSWSDKLNAQKQTSDKIVTNLKTQLEKVVIDNALNTIAGEIFTKPSRDVRLLRDRVSVDYEGETPVIRVRDKEGNPSAMTINDLKQETLDNPEFKDILVGSKATGSGGTGGNQGGGAPKQPSEMNDAERTSLYKTNPTEYRRLFPEQTA